MSFKVTLGNIHTGDFNTFNYFILQKSGINWKAGGWPYFSSVAQRHWNQILLDMYIHIKIVCIYIYTVILIDP